MNIKLIKKFIDFSHKPVLKFTYRLNMHLRLFFLPIRELLWFRTSIHQPIRRLECLPNNSARGWCIAKLLYNVCI